MSEQDPGSQGVSERTRAFEKEDAQVFSGAGRGPTSDETAAAERAAPIAEHTRQAYKEMVYRGAHQEGEGRIHR
jgi:hypothetical protein